MKKRTIPTVLNLSSTELRIFEVLKESPLITDTDWRSGVTRTSIKYSISH